MGYYLTRTKIFFSKIIESVLNFFGYVNFSVRKVLNVVRHSEKTKTASHHVKKAGKSLISRTKENARDWSDRLVFSENFRIHDEDV